MFDAKQQEATLIESALLKTSLFLFEIQPKWVFECSKHPPTNPPTGHVFLNVKKGPENENDSNAER